MKRRTRILIITAAAVVLVAAAVVATSALVAGGGRPASETAASMVGCRVSLTTPAGYDEGGKVVEVRPGSGGQPELHTQWGWFDDSGKDLTVGDPSFKPPTWASDEWVPYSRVHGYTCDGGTTWTWVTK